MELNAYAKINLSIDVLREMENGYHEIRMIMQSVSLHDSISFRKREKDIKIYCTNPYVPCDSRNTVYKALELLRQRLSICDGMEVDIEKRIPVAAGLGGGSSDAAASIIAANEIWGLGMSIEEMMKLGSEVGADVPFCIARGTSIAEGIGEKITRLPLMDKVNIVLAKPPVFVSTKEVYSSLKMDEIVVRPDIDKLVKAIYDRNIMFIASNMVNVLETVTMKKYPIIQEIKSIMLQFGALGSLMSGSGPTVFGIFADKGCSEMCYNRLIDYIKEVYIVETV